MNYNIQLRIEEIINKLEASILNINAKPEALQNNWFLSHYNWNNKVDDAIRNIINELTFKYAGELEELKIKKAIIEDIKYGWNGGDDSRQFVSSLKNIMPYFFDESFMKIIVTKAPDMLFFLDEHIIQIYKLKWKEGYRKLVLHAINNTSNSVYSIEMILSRMTDNTITDNNIERIPFLFSDELFLKSELDQKIEKFYGRNLLLDALEQNGLLIKYINSIDTEIVLTSLLNVSAPLEHLQEHLQEEYQNDLLVVLFALFNSGYSLKFASQHLKDNEALANISFNNSNTPYRDTYSFISERLKADRDLAIMVSKCFGLGIQYMSDNLRNDPEIVKNCILNNGLAIQFVPDNFKEDSNMAMLAINQTKYAFDHISPNLKNNRDFIATLILSNPSIQTYIPKIYLNVN
jgi:hypothetical protein